MSLHFNPARRHVMGHLVSLAAASTVPAFSQPVKTDNSARTLAVVQIADMSESQIDVSKDFVVGARAAWQYINIKGGLRGRQVQHRTVEVDGSKAGLRSALDGLKGQTHVVACSGTVGGRAAAQVTDLLRRESPGLPHIAPWLQSTPSVADDNTFAIFASRQEQIAHAVRALSLVGVPELGAVYASEAEYQAYHEEMENTAAYLKMRLKAYGPAADLPQLAQTLNAQSPRTLIFLGGTPELVQFSQVVERQGALRYIIAMADVNLQTLSQLGKAQHARVIATQVVPLVNSNVPLAREYRETLAKLFDEPPTPQGLAGYLAARYTFEAMLAVDGTPTRPSLMHALQRRISSEIGGFRIELGGQRRTGSYVTQSMLSQDGRVVG